MRFVFCFLALFCITGTAHAQMIENLDLKRLQPDTARAVIKDLREADVVEKEAKSSTVPAISATSAKEWASVGEDIAKGISATAAALSLQVNDFVNTPVGRWSFALIVWYVVGANIASTALNIVLWLVCTTFIWRSFRIFHMGRTVTTAVTGSSPVTQTVYYRWESSVAKVWSAIAHPVVFVLFTFLFLSHLRLT